MFPTIGPNVDDIQDMILCNYNISVQYITVFGFYSNRIYFW